MKDIRLNEYRAMAGLQLLFGQRGDSHKVMEMQFALEKWIAEQVRFDVVLALEQMKAHPIKEIPCNMTRDEIAAYRMLQGVGMKLFAEEGFEVWRLHQIQKVELFVDGLIAERVLGAVKPFLTITVN
jgi:hypothetical protein